MHAVQADAPVVNALYEPAGQAVHSMDELAATKALKVPAGHAVHTSDVHATGWLLYRPMPLVTHVPLDW